MAKQYDNWCDKQYQKQETKFDIGTLAHILVNKLTEWTLHDMTLSENLNEYQILNQRRRMQNILRLAEQIECLSVDANSIYAVRQVDFDERRRKWLQAKGYCFQLTVMLTHLTNYCARNTNIQKYLNLQSDIKTLTTKIKNVMIKDEKLRKEKFKQTPT